MLHVGDTLVPVEPDELSQRMLAAGMIEPQLSTGGRSLRFRARAPE
jgi:hypothetical protein